MINFNKIRIVIFLLFIIFQIQFSQAFSLETTNLITDNNGNKIEVTNYGPYGDILEGGNERFNYNKRGDKNK